MPKIIKGNATANYIGIDPGLNGGLVMLSMFNEYRVIQASPMPDTERDIWNWFNTVCNLNTGPKFALIEKVHSMPSQSSQSGFTFGRNYGFLRACLTASKCTWEDITPQAWLKLLSIPSGKKSEVSKNEWKDSLRERAQNLFPDLPIWNEKKSITKQRAISDALLIAECCRRKFG